MNKKAVLSSIMLAGTVFAYAGGNKIKFKEYDLDNGLHVILHEDNSSPVVAVTVMYHVGSKNEETNRTGMAHFFEHLLFEGSENIGRGEYDTYVENAGGTLNANTTQDRTFYYELLPSNQLELGLWLESERMLHAKVESIGIETQREVVKEEKRQRVDNTPYGSIISETFSHAFTVHPYRWAPIGSMEDLNAASDEDFMAFYKKFYIPNNAVLSIAGDIDIKETMALIEKYFSGIPRGEEVVQPSVTEPAKTAEVRDVIYDNIQLPAVIQAYHMPKEGTEDYYALSMLSTILADGESSRMTKAIVNDKQLAVAAGAFAYALEDAGLAIAFGIANQGVTPEDLEAAMNEEIEKVKTELISEKEFQKLQNKTENDFITANSTMAGIAESLANYHMYYGDANLVNTEIKRYMKVTREDLMRVAKKYLTPENRVVLYYLAQTEEDNASNQ